MEGRRHGEDTAAREMRISKATVRVEVGAANRVVGGAANRWFSPPYFEKKGTCAGVEGGEDGHDEVGGGRWEVRGARCEVQQDGASGEPIGRARSSSGRVLQKGAVAAVSGAYAYRIFEYSCIFCCWGAWGGWDLGPSSGPWSWLGRPVACGSVGGPEAPLRDQ